MIAKFDSRNNRIAAAVSAFLLIVILLSLLLTSLICPNQPMPAQLPEFRQPVTQQDSSSDQDKKKNDDSREDKDNDRGNHAQLASNVNASTAVSTTAELLAAEIASYTDTCDPLGLQTTAHGDTPTTGSFSYTLTGKADRVNRLIAFDTTLVSHKDTSDNDKFWDQQGRTQEIGFTFTHNQPEIKDGEVEYKPRANAGGTITFTLSADTLLTDVGILDNDHASAKIYVYNSEGELVAQFKIKRGTEATYQEIAIMAIGRTFVFDIQDSHVTFPRFKCKSNQTFVTFKTTTTPQEVPASLPKTGIAEVGQMCVDTQSEAIADLQVCKTDE